MTTPESRVLSTPIRSTLIGAVCAAAIWIIMGVLWFARTSWDSSATSIGGFLGITALYLFSLGFYLNIDSAGIDKRWGGVRHRHTIQKWMALAAFIVAVISPCLSGKDINGPQAMNIVAIVSLVFIGITVFITLCIQLATAWPTLRKLPFPLSWIVDPPYDVWRVFQDLLGVWVTILFAYAYTACTPLCDDAVMAPIFSLLTVFGVVSWIYSSFLQRFVFKGRRMVITGVRSLASKTVEITLEPTDDKPVRKGLPGQYVCLSAPGVVNGPHPFMEISAPGRDILQIAVKVSGIDTRVLRETVGVGMKVHVRGPYGDLDLRRATPRQVWIAAGIGITPFISWLRAIDALIDEKIHRSGVRSSKIRKVASQEVMEQLGIHKVDLWFFHHGEPAYAEELYYWESRFSWLEVHIRDTTQVDRQTAAEIIEETPGLDPANLDGVSAVLCGPAEMMRDYSQNLDELGVYPIIREDFSFR